MSGEAKAHNGICKLHCSPSPLTFTLKQPSAASSRWTHAKITTHNLATTNLTITANFYSKGFALLLR